MKYTSLRKKAIIKIVDTIFCSIKIEPIFMIQSLDVKPYRDSFFNTTEYTYNLQQVTDLAKLNAHIFLHAFSVLPSRTI